MSLKDIYDAIQQAKTASDMMDLYRARERGVDHPKYAEKFMLTHV